MKGLSTIKRGLNCDRYVTGFAPAQRFLWSQILCRLQTEVPVCIRVQKDRVRTLKILWSLSVFGRLRQHPNNLACTESVRVFIMLNSDTTLKILYGTLCHPASEILLPFHCLNPDSKLTCLRQLSASRVSAVFSPRLPPFTSHLPPPQPPTLTPRMNVLPECFNCHGC